MKVIIIIILAIVINILWYDMRRILKSNGYKVLYLFLLPDLPNFLDLINKEENLKLKSKYRKIFWGIIICLILLIIMVFTSE